jgi:hypothetical protein
MDYKVKLAYLTFEPDVTNLDRASTFMSMISSIPN